MHLLYCVPSTTLTSTHCLQFQYITVYIVQCFVRSTGRGKSIFVLKPWFQYYNVVELQSFADNNSSHRRSSLYRKNSSCHDVSYSYSREPEYPGLGTPASSRSLNSSSCECGRSKTFFVLSSLSLSLFATSPALLFLFSLLSLASSVYYVYYVFLILPSS